MKLAYTMWIIALVLVIALFCLIGCSSSSDNGTNTPNCVNSGDTLMSCGDTNYKVF